MYVLHFVMCDRGEKIHINRDIFLRTWLMQYGRQAKMGTAPKVNAWKVFLRPILSEIAAQPMRPAKLPTAIAIR